MPHGVRLTTFSGSARRCCVCCRSMWRCSVAQLAGLSHGPALRIPALLRGACGLPSYRRSLRYRLLTAGGCALDRCGQDVSPFLPPVASWMFVLMTTGCLPQRSWRDVASFVYWPIVCCCPWCSRAGIRYRFAAAWRASPCLVCVLGVYRHG